MTNIFHHILIASVVLSLTCAPAIVNAMPEPSPVAMTEKEKAAAAKAKEAEKKKKEAEKAKAAKEKEKAKAAAAKQKEKDKAAAEKEKQKAAADKEKAKQAAERAKLAAEREEERARKEAEAQQKEAKAIRDYQKYQEDLENPKPEVISYVGIGLRAGYSALLDRFEGKYLGAGTINTSNPLQQIKGGGGVGLDVTYNLEYEHFLMEVGLDFRFLNSTSNYGFNVKRLDKTYGATYSYLFDNLAETRNIVQVGMPWMFGAQFDRYYFLLGAKTYYNIGGNYKHKGQYDIVVNDNAYLEPYGMGIHDVPGETRQPMKFIAFTDLSLAAEIGIDLDEWLQQSPDPKKKKKVQPGERLPFGREHVHYRVGLFAEYGVLNINNTSLASPVEFGSSDVTVKNTNTLLAMQPQPKVNTLFVGAKFLVQFEIPGRKARPVPPPPAYAMYSVVDAQTNQPLPLAFVETTNSKGKVTLKEKQITPKGFRQKCALGSYTAEAKAEGYYNATQSFNIEEVGTTEYVTIAMRHRPVLRVRVTNKETGLAVPANIQIRKRGETATAYTLSTDSINSSASQMLEEGPQYTLRIAQMGYDTLDMSIDNIGDSLNIQLVPVKKGEVFIVKNLFFATNKTRILPTSEGALNDLYMYLARNPKVRIKIIGHTDNVGKVEANQKLSEGRANAVKQDLIERGLTPDRLEAEGRGEKQPIDTNDTEEGRQNNRRVEIEIL